MNTNYCAAPSILKKDDRYFSVLEDRRDGRPEYAIDRDRILYSSSFRNLSDKTQVFLSDDIFDLRTRLTHTLEVNQIAKTIITSLGCNLDLTEAIALGHDVGHTPFGHVGERTLALLMNGCESIGIKIAEGNQGFKHNLQSARVLCEIEGLNLSKYTLWGIMNHSSLNYKECKTQQGICYSIHHPSQCQKCNKPKKIISCDIYDSIIRQINGDKYWSIEGLAVEVADEIAQRHHDIEDSLRFNIVSRETLLEKLTIFEDVFTDYDLELYEKLKQLGKAPLNEFLSQFSRLIVKSYVINLIDETKKRINTMLVNKDINSADSFRDKRFEIDITEAKQLVSFSGRFKDKDDKFKEFLKNEILNSYTAQTMDGKGAFIVRRLFKAYMANPSLLPDDAIRAFYKSSRHKGYNTIGEMRGNINSLRNTDSRRNALMRTVADYIGSLTDANAYNQYDRLYGTKV